MLMGTTNKTPGGTSGIQINANDLKDPQLYRLNRRLDLMDQQTQAAATAANNAAAAAAAKAAGTIPTADQVGADPSLTVPGWTVKLAKLTTGGALGSLTVDKHGRITAYTAPT
jgi:hypothetical protein